jgi:polyisoprenoid-binding protein YceI
MRIRRVLSLLTVVLAVCGSALAADEYKIDPVHSTVGFAVKHMAVSTVHGRFTDFSGSILYDEKDPSKSSVDVTIKAPSINTDNNGRDNDLRSPNFLDVAKFPEISFKSKSVEKKGDGFVAHGTLTIHGVAKDVDLPFTLSGPLATPRGKVLGAEAGLSINRQDYGVVWNGKLPGGELMVSNDVKIELNVEAHGAQPAPTAK